MTTAPDLTRKVLGFRKFLVKDGQLSSIGMRPGEFFWMPGPNKARCLVDPNHVAPEPGCHCGFNVYSNVQKPWLQSELLNPNIVAGTVTAWGDLEVHGPYGFRAEIAQINMLGYDPHIGPKKVKKIHKIARLYEIRAVPIEDLEKESKEFGEVIPPSLYPDQEDAEKNNPEEFSNGAVLTPGYIRLMLGNESRDVPKGYPLISQGSSHFWYGDPSLRTRSPDMLNNEVLNRKQRRDKERQENRERATGHLRRYDPKSR